MNRRALVLAVIVVLFIGGFILRAQSPRGAEGQLKAAENKELVEGDLRGAIELYKKLAQSSDKSVAARALVRLGASYEKQGSTEARKMYEQVLSKFGDQQAAATEARSRLAAMGGASVSGSPTTVRVADGPWREQSPIALGSMAMDMPIVTFTSLADELVLGNLITGETHNLTPRGAVPQDGGRVLRTVISDDGRLVLYTWVASSQTRNEIRSINSDGTGMRTWLSSNETLNSVPIALSPDKKTALVIVPGPSRSQSFELLSLLDGTLRPFGTIGNAPALNTTGRFSPDGKQLVFATSQSRLLLSNMDGSDAHTLLDERAQSPVWTPDGKWIVFLSNRTGSTGIWAIPATGGAPRLLKTDEGVRYLHGFTRDGSLYYSTVVPQSDVNSIQVDPTSLAITGRSARFVDTFLARNERPLFSPDGKWIAWLSNRQGNGTSPVFPADLTVVVRSVSGGPEMIVPGGFPITWFPDSRALLQRRTENDEEVFSRFEVADGRVSELYRGPSIKFSPQASNGARVVSPDGNGLIGIRCPPATPAPATSSKTCDLVHFDFRTRSETVETLGPFQSVSGGGTMRISPDGRWLAAIGYPLTGKTDRLFVKPLAGGPALELTEGDFAFGLAWSPDSTRVIYAATGSSGKDETRAISVRGGASVLIPIDGIEPTMEPGGRLAYLSMSTVKGTWVARNLLPIN